MHDPDSRSARDVSTDQDRGRTEHLENPARSRSRVVFVLSCRCKSSEAASQDFDLREGTSYDQVSKSQELAGAPFNGCVGGPVLRVRAQPRCNRYGTCRCPLVERARVERRDPSGGKSRPYPLNTLIWAFMVPRYASRQRQRSHKGNSGLVASHHASGAHNGGS